MGNLTWDNKYSVRIGELDRQHQRLFDLVGNLNTAMLQGKGKDMIGKILQELITYTQTHFAAEEKLMSAHQYPEYDGHKRTHSEFVQKVATFQNRFKQSSSFITLEVMNMLEEWLVNHIQKVDQAYGPFLQGKEVN